MTSREIVCAGMAFAVGPCSFLAIRLLLGIAEAGFFLCGRDTVLAVLLPAQYRGRIVALFMVAIPLSSFFGLPIWLPCFNSTACSAVTVGNGCSCSRRSRPPCSGRLPSSCPTGRSRPGELGAATVAHRAVGAREIIAKSQSRPSLALGRPSRTNTSWLVRSSMRAPPAQATASFRQRQIIKSSADIQMGLLNLIPFGIASVLVSWPRAALSSSAISGF